MGETSSFFDLPRLLVRALILSLCSVEYDLARWKCDGSIAKGGEQDSVYLGDSLS